MNTSPTWVSMVTPADGLPLSASMTRPLRTAPPACVKCGDEPRVGVLAERRSLPRAVLLGQFTRQRQLRIGFLGARSPARAVDPILAAGLGGGSGGAGAAGAGRARVRLLRRGRGRARRVSTGAGAGGAMREPRSKRRRRRPQGPVTEATAAPRRCPAGLQTPLRSSRLDAGSPARARRLARCAPARRRQGQPRVPAPDPPIRCPPIAAPPAARGASDPRCRRTRAPESRARPGRPRRRRPAVSTTACFASAWEESAALARCGPARLLLPDAPLRANLLPPNLLAASQPNAGFFRVRDCQEKSLM